MLTSAANEADSLGCKLIGTEHLLLAMLRDAQLPSAKELSRFELDFESVKKKIAELRDEISVDAKLAQSRQLRLLGRMRLRFTDRSGAWKL